MYLQWSEKTIERLEKEGRGKGIGASYKPWIGHTDFSPDSKARSVKGLKIPRTHFLLSEIEYKFFVCAEWSSEVIDIQEQFPLPRKVSQPVADKLRIRHPFYRGTNVPTVMTVDFLLTMQRQDGERYYRAVNIKADSAVEDRRTLDKLEIQQATLAELNIHQHHLVVESSIPHNVAWNLDLIRTKLPRDLELPENIVMLHSLKDQMLRWSQRLDDKQRDMSGHMLCSHFDEHFGQPEGTGIRVLASLFHEKALPVNLGVKSLFDAPWSVVVNDGRKGDELGILRAA
ncbi:TnsA endonuclease N-terminal domain-containing protein [Paucibacter sp. R3-3]|uniref:TnsA endonuclease N-terminal domain-containing protein n=1 Tax=Roseateles agri TaxID=3098619 RepID=A0ABU5DEU0_9BURK|nr:TnsA endonuclease N-terminal domain-containing protein [Paucibacter sp. R3-3]MDY0744787.1 TnsA endonuclease N-terminal domain-containing protein [Paucibacter sp. R3-3]